jgi:hypothetical protein
MAGLQKMLNAVWSVVGCRDIGQPTRFDIRIGGWPKNLLYSRLNWLALS